MPQLLEEEWYFANGWSSGWYVFNSERSKVYFKSTDGAIGEALWSDNVFDESTVRPATDQEVREFTLCS